MIVKHKGRATLIVASGPLEDTKDRRGCASFTAD